MADERKTNGRARHIISSFQDALPGIKYKFVKGQSGAYWWEEMDPDAPGGVQLVLPSPPKEATVTVIKPKYTRVSKFKTNDPKVGERKLTISDDALDELAKWCFVVGNNVELNGLGLVSEDDDGNITLERIFMCSKHANAGSVGLDEEKQAAAIGAVMADGRSPRDLRCYWHFHTMSAFWSQQDEDAIERELAWSGGKEIVNLVLEGMRDMKARVDHIDEETGEFVSEGLNIDTGEKYGEYLSAARASLGGSIRLTAPRAATVSNVDRGRTPWLNDGGSTLDDGSGLTLWGDDEDFADIDEFCRVYPGDSALDEEGAWIPEAERWLLERGLCPECFEELIWDGTWNECPICRHQWSYDFRPRFRRGAKCTSVVLYDSADRTAEDGGAIS